MPDFLEDCILWCEDRHQSTGEYLWQGNLKASVYKLSVDGEVTVVVSVFGVDGVACTDGAVAGPASSANSTFEVVECFNCASVSSSEFDIINTSWKLLAACWKLLRFSSDWLVKWFKAKREWGKFAFSIWALELELLGVHLLYVLPSCVIAEYSRFCGANSLHNSSLEFG